MNFVMWDGLNAKYISINGWNKYLSKDIVYPGGQWEIREYFTWKFNSYLILSNNHTAREITLEQVMKEIPNFFELIL